MEFIKWTIVLLLKITFSVVSSKILVNDTLPTQKYNLKKNHAIRSIQSEDGDIIDCIDIYKQPAFDHPALRDHKIQLKPSYNIKKMEKSASKKMYVGRNKGSPVTITTQIWHKNGKCPKGTIPIRRIKKKKKKKKNVSNMRKKAKSLQFNESKKLYLLQMNHSIAVLHTEGYAYLGAKGDIQVWNPKVESDDEYSTSHVALKNGFQALEAGWAVNPSVYGDSQTRLFVYWTADGSEKTGCFDLTCPGFVQTSHEIALGAAIYPISKPNGLPYQIIIYIHRDRETGNWWLQYGESMNIGYWPQDLFDMLKAHAEIVQWGGEVYSSRLGTHPHTSTEMGSGQFPEWVMGTSGSIKRMRVLLNNMVLTLPEWFNGYSDEYDCYGVYFIHDYVEDPEFFYGGPGRNPMCP